MGNWVERLGSTVEGRFLLEQERVVLEATEALSRVMEEQGITKAELARRLRVSPAYITKLLSGSNNSTLRTMASAFYALGRSLHLDHKPGGDDIRVPTGWVLVSGLSVGRWDDLPTWNGLPYGREGHTGSPAPGGEAPGPSPHPIAA